MAEMTVKVPTQIAEWVERGDLTLDDVEHAFETAAAEPVLSTLTSNQQALLVAASGLSDDGRRQLSEALAHPEQTTAVRAARLVAQQLTQATPARSIAHEIGKDPSTITRWWREEKLLGFIDDHGVLRVPRWQFVDNRLVPGLSQVVAHRGAVSLASIAAFMTDPNRDLDGLSPRQWLVDGGDPGLVADLLDAMNTW